MKVFFLFLHKLITITMKTLKITFGILLIVVSVTLTTMCITAYLPYKNLFSAKPEAITTGETNYNPGDRLELVDCRCNDGTEGSTLRCKKTGDRELCSSTQQGSNACYKGLTFKLACEGDDVDFFE